MGIEINLLENYPRTKRNVQERGATKTDADRALARQFGKDFFDGDRKVGYGGFSYNPRFWQPVIPTFQKFYSLKPGDKVLDVGCAKGFMLHDFKELMPEIEVRGIDISSYAVENGHPNVKQDLQVADARKLPFEDNSFDLVISINTVHNLDGDDLIQAFKEIDRVSRKGAFITVDAYRDEIEKEAMFAWNLTAKTILHVDEWKALFKKIGFKGDYFWFMP